jgi:hypothetical protein
MRSIFSPAPVLLLCACFPTAGPVTCSLADDELGEAGLVNFTAVVDYPETDGLTAAPIGVGLPFLVTLEHPAEEAADGVFADATLSVEPEDPTDVAEVFALGAGQFVVFLNNEGSYRLVAEKDAQPLDALTVSAAAVARVRLANRALLSTDGEECTTSEELLSLDGLVLRQNQQLDIALVPTDLNDSPLLGLLTVRGDGGETLAVTAFPFQEGVVANSLSLRPAGRLGGEIAVDLEVEETGEVVPLRFSSSAEDAAVVCE